MRTRTPPEPGAVLLANEPSGTLWQLRTGDTLLVRTASSGRPMAEWLRLRLAHEFGTERFHDGTDDGERPELPDDPADADDADPDRFEALVEACRGVGLEIPDEVQDLAGLIIAVKANPPIEDDEDDDDDELDELDGGMSMRMGHGFKKSNLRHPHDGIQSYLHRLNTTNRTKKARASRLRAMENMLGWAKQRS